MCPGIGYSLCFVYGDCTFPSQGLLRRCQNGETDIRIAKPRPGDVQHVEHGTGFATCPFQARNRGSRDVQGTIPEWMQGKSGLIFAGLGISGARSGHSGVQVAVLAPPGRPQAGKCAIPAKKTSIPGPAGHHPGADAGQIRFDFRVLEASEARSGHSGVEFAVLAPPGKPRAGKCGFSNGKTTIPRPPRRPQAGKCAFS